MVDIGHDISAVYRMREELGELEGEESGEAEVDLCAPRAVTLRSS